MSFPVNSRDRDHAESRSGQLEPPTPPERFRPEASPRQADHWRRGITVLSAGLCIAALISSTTLQLRTPSRALEPDEVVGSQRLSVGGSRDDFSKPETYELVEEEPAPPSGNLSADSFVNNTDAQVQYPFQHGVPLTDGFGYREYPVEQMHAAQDFAAGAGTPVRAIADGVVVESGFTADGCGFGVKLEHLIESKVTTSRYCHMQEGSLEVQKGNRVFVGQVVGRVGNTGWSFGPHLHLEISVEGELVDPMPFLKKYNGIRDI